jgi:hypothetical protein
MTTFRVDFRQETVTNVHCPMDDYAADHAPKISVHNVELPPASALPFAQCIDLNQDMEEASPDEATTVNPSELGKAMSILNEIQESKHGAAQEPCHDNADFIRAERGLTFAEAPRRSERETEDKLRADLNQL